MYLDSAYIAKVYVDEPDSEAIAERLQSARVRYSSALSIAEVNCVFLRKVREGKISRSQCLELTATFRDNVAGGVWRMIPVTDKLLQRTSLLAVSGAGFFLRAADAIHLITAQDLGEAEIWTSDRHMLAAAPHFGLAGRSV